MIAPTPTLIGNSGHHCASSVFSDIRWARRRGPVSEQPQCLIGIANQKVLCFLIVIEHHFVGLAAEARFLVSAESGMRRIGVIAVRPYASRLDTAADPIG